ncbi:MAG: hypothetical protein ACFFAE_03245 [Candidatus Hodarchaeota archaeon]
MKMEEWEISFNLSAGDRSEHFQFNINPVKDMTKEFPSFPKDNFLRALKSHGESNKYNLHSGMITDLKIKHTSELHENQEIHILMLVMEKIGPISLIFRQRFEHLILEGIDSHYNYIGSEALLNILVQVIKPESPTVKGLGKITTIYYASNIVELSRKESFVSFLDSTEGQILIFGLSIILPTVLIIILPIQVLDSMPGYLISLGVLSILWCIFPIAKRSTRYAPLAVISALGSYLIIEILIVLKLRVGGINPWGIFSNISRQNLLTELKNQEIISELGYEVFLGIELLELIIPFLDSIFILLIPFSVGVGLSGLFMISKREWKSAAVLRVIFAAIFLIAIIIIPLGYHALGKGSEGTLHASIGLIETAEMFTPPYIQELEANYGELLELIASAQQHLEKANNSFEQFGQNPLIAFILPYLMPEVAGIPLEDLPEILTLTGTLADTVPYIPNILWGYNNLQTGLNQTFYLLQQTIENLPQPGGLGSEISQEYDISMLIALRILQRGTNNLSFVESQILHLISEIQEKLDYSIFAEISNLLTELEIGLPILITIVNSSVPWINSTYKFTLALNDLYDLNFASNILIEAEKDYNSSLDMQTIDLESLSEDAVIPIRDLANFSLNMHRVSKYFMFSLKNASSMFQALNSTLLQIQGINFSNSSNILDRRWGEINQGLNNTSNYLVQTQTSLDNMSSIIAFQESFEFKELADLNQLLKNLEDFTHSASERVDIVDQYVSALNGTFQSVRYFSLGSYSLNKTLSEAVNGTGSFEPQTAILNFTLCQLEANKTHETLAGVRGRLLNESAVDNWQDLVRGNITDNNTNSIYMNAQHSLYLISDIEAAIAEAQDISPFLTTFQQILNRMEQLDDNWDVFTL